MRLGLLAGCGGGPPAETVSVAPASMAHLKEIVLQFPDLPTGSTAHPHKVDPNAAANQAATATSTIKISGNGKDVVRYSSQAFISGPMLSAMMTAQRYDAPLSESQVTSLFAVVANRAATE